MFRNVLYVIVTSVIITFSSCSQRPLADDVCTSTLTSITASSSNEDPETKTILDGVTLKSSWLAGDEINVFFGSSVSSRFVCQSSGEIAQFKGSIDVVTGGGEGLDDNTSLWGVYPYDEDTTCDGQSILYTLPGNQKARSGSFADDLFPTIARSRNFYMSFYNICGSFRFTVSNPDIVKVTLRGCQGETLAGRARISMDKYPEVVAVVDGITELIMNAPEGGCFEVGEDYYFAVYPTEFKSGIVITFYKENSKAEYLHNSTYNLQRNKFARFRDKDNGLTFVDIPLNDWENGEQVEDEI